MNVFWHQRDLRIPDNRGLAASTADDTTLPVYIVDDNVLKSIGDRQRAFLYAGLGRLRDQYRRLGSDLVIRQGEPVDQLGTILKAYDVETVYYNTHYNPDRRARQQRVDDTFGTEPVIDLTLVDPAELADSYPTHSQFYNEWQKAPKPTPVTVHTESLADVVDETPVPDRQADIDLPQAGYQAARSRYDAFLANGIETYNDTRDDMQQAVDQPVGAVSRLSPYLAAGLIGIREVWADATERYEAANEESTRRNIEKFRYELSWREHHYHLLSNNPELPTANYKSLPNPIAWENDPEQLAAWKAGRTGYPLVDAGMRQLDREGYIHNRPRQNVASFLTKHLLIDWRTGADYFAEKLVDFDPANNSANWQWIASTGTDSVDVRIFDPVAQMAKYDDQAVYVKAYVPELRGVAAEEIVEWPNLSTQKRQELAPEYDDPIVDRNAAYERAKRVFNRAVGK